MTPDDPSSATLAGIRDRAFLIADEDVTFPEDEQDPLPPGRRRPLSFGEEQADIINATGA